MLRQTERDQARRFILDGYSIDEVVAFVGRGIDLAGQQFGRWTVVGVSPRLSSQSKRLWVCHCDCGGKGLVTTSSLRQGKSRSCGCLQKDVATKHGGRNTRTYVCWKGMKSRCYQANDPYFHRYGGRGIKVCERWRVDYPAFLEDMGERPIGMTLDRIDNDGDYEPENCRWSDAKQQALGRSDTIHLTVYGQTLCQSDWARLCGRHVSWLSGVRARTGRKPEDVIRDHIQRHGIAQEIKNERRQLQAAEFRAYHLKQEG